MSSPVFNFNGHTPDAPPRSRNAVFQSDEENNVSAHFPYPAETAFIDPPAYSADFSQLLHSALPSQGGLYRISVYVIVTQAATTSSTLPAISVSWKDGDNGQAQTLQLTPSNSGNLLTTFQQGSAVIGVGASTDVTISSSGYASSGATQMKYTVHATLEAL